MKTFGLLFLIGMSLSQMGMAQSTQDPISLDIMTVALSQASIDSVPVKVSLPKTVRSSELMFPVSEERSGTIFILGTPYDSLRVQIPADISVANQFGEQADLQKFQLMYGSSDDESLMEVVPPAGCLTVQIPKTGRIHFRLGGTLISGEELRGTYTGSVRLDCNSQ